MCHYILLREKGQNIPVKSKRILRIEGAGNYADIHLKNGKVFKMQVGSIGFWKKEVSKSKKFVLANRSHLVNYKCVVGFSRAGGVALRLCSAKKYSVLLAMPESSAKDEAISKNTFRTELSQEGFIELMFYFCPDREEE